MSRQKKSRKPSAFGPSKAPKQKKSAIKDTEKRVKKGKGKSSGSRNNPDALKPAKTAGAQKAEKKDPRHGSNKPIELAPKPAPSKIEKPVIHDFEPKVQLTKAKEPELTPEQELEAIENDTRLLALLERKENDELITGKDAKYFNAKMARHQQLLELLGLDDEEDESEDDDEFDISDERSLIEQWEDDDNFGDYEQ